MTMTPASPIRTAAEKHAVGKAPVLGVNAPAFSHATFKVRPENGLTHADMERIEWLLTDGEGGLSMGTASGIPTRRYHAWMTPALNPPVGRAVLLHSAVERVLITWDGEPETASESAVWLDLSSYQFGGGVVHPQGASSLVEFEKSAGVAWTYRFQVTGRGGRVGGEVIVRRELAIARPGAVAVRYRMISAPTGARVRLEIRPLVAMRDFHELTSGKWGDASQMAVSTVPGVVSVRGPDRGAMKIPPVNMAMGASSGACVFGGGGQWWYDFEYRRDQERGQDFREDLFSPGVFVAQTAPGEDVELRAWVGDDPGPSIEHAGEVETERIGRAAAFALEGVGSGIDAVEREAINALIGAADQFVVRRSLPEWETPSSARTHSTSVIAGYPWFSDWGRDTMISLPGLLLATGRLPEAKAVLEGFAALNKRGLIPNCFDNETGHAEYNTVDASLWFVHAACRYAFASGDTSVAEGPIGAACMSIFEAYQQGTDFGIKVDQTDGLVSAGDATTQLTWMDARRDGVVFTPRAGKPVEINALWYSGIMGLCDLFERTRPRTARDLRQIAERVRLSFQARFFDAYRQMCFDIAPGSATSYGGPRNDPAYQIRPNQIFAVSLPYSPLTGEQQQAVVRAVRQSLLTPMGLRTLASNDPDYQQRYEGSLFLRDRAYHNGTVWPWLIGPYAEAVMRVGHFSEASRHDARSVLRPLIHELLTPRAGRAVGTISEVYDADETPSHPRRPDGCPAQAWSVAELLRVLLLAIPRAVRV
jgi:predicted glycogen debranching enzyme